MFNTSKLFFFIFYPVNCIVGSLPMLVLVLKCFS